jgi:primosomal protein N' (replication factor Y)
VLIQTFQPEHYAVRAALEHDDEGFAREELRFRRTFHYPPYSRLIQVLAEDRSGPAAKEALDALAALVSRDPASSEIRCLGPAPAPFERLAGKWRFQFLLRGPSAGRLRRLVQAALRDLPARQRALLTVDVDPYDLL